MRSGEAGEKTGSGGAFRLVVVVSGGSMVMVSGER